MILSVSRRTDIPNYYPEWFIRRLEEGYLYVRNPINARQVGRINLSPKVVDCIVFWTKNPENMMAYLDSINAYPYYFQFTLNGYGADVEPGLPGLEHLIGVFQKLSEKIGSSRVIWRYDPIFLSSEHTLEEHTRTFAKICEKLKGYTQRVVISFIDFYAKTVRNTKNTDIRGLTENEMNVLAGHLAEIAEQNQMDIVSCAESIDLERVGVKHGCCIDKELVEKIIGCRLIGKKDRNQREECGCFESIDVGTYNTCLCGCRYCYANDNKIRTERTAGSYDAVSPILCGELRDGDKIYERRM